MKNMKYSFDFDECVSEEDYKIVVSNVLDQHREFLVNLWIGKSREFRTKTTRVFYNIETNEPETVDEHDSRVSREIALIEKFGMFLETLDIALSSVALSELKPFH